MASGKSPRMLMHNAGIFNPVLVQAVGLCPVVAMATSVKSAALLAAVSAVIVILSEIIASLFLKSVPRWIRIGIYIILGAAIVSPFMILIERMSTPLFSSLGIYLPIMAVNSLIVLRCERFAVKIAPLKALWDGVTASAGYAAVLIVTGFFREILGSGTLFGKVIFKTPALSGLLLPFGGFLFLGFAGAVLRAMIAKFWPKYLDKKQPKPGNKKKHHHETAIKPSGNPGTNLIPEFIADESPFTLEELDIITNEQPENITAETTDESEAEEVQTESNITPEKSDDTELSVEETADEKEENTAVESDSEEAEKPAEEEPKPVFADLTIDDISAGDGAEYESYSEADEDLDALMNRSIDDILTKQKKEEDEE